MLPLSPPARPRRRALVACVGAAAALSTSLATLAVVPSSAAAAPVPSGAQAVSLVDLDLAVVLQGDLLRLGHTGGVLAGVLGSARVDLTSTTHPDRTWSYRVPTGLLGLLGGVVELDPRDPLGSDVTAVLAQPEGFAGWLPNDEYDVQTFVTPLLGDTVGSTVETLRLDSFTGPAQLGSSLTEGGTLETLDFSLPELPLLGSVRAVLSGRDGCEDVTIAYAGAPTQVSTLVDRFGEVSGTAAQATGALERGCRYDVAVRWSNADGDPAYPSLLPGVLDGVSDVLVPVLAPTAPLGLQVRPLVDGLGISWSPPTDTGGDDVLEYLVSVLPRAGGSGGGSCLTTALACEVTGLVEGVVYNVVVTVTNSGGSTDSGPVPAVPGLSPSAPTSVTAKPGNGFAAVTWAPGTSGGATPTRWTATASPGGASCAAPAEVRTCRISGLRNGTTYTVTVTATSQLFSSAPSEAATVRPSAPAPLRARAAQAAKKAPGRAPAVLVKVTSSRAATLAVRLSRGKLVAVRSGPVRAGTSWVRVPLKQRTRKLLNGKPLTMQVRAGGRVLDAHSGRVLRR